VDEGVRLRGPNEINSVFTVTGGYAALVNNTAEAIRAGAKLVGLKSTPGMAGIPGIIDAIRVDGAPHVVSRFL
jgi:hypothetical protein